VEGSSTAMDGKVAVLLGEAFGLGGAVLCVDDVFGEGVTSITALDDGAEVLMIGFIL
jgi:hypothetical protein